MMKPTCACLILLATALPAFAYQPPPTKVITPSEEIAQNMQHCLSQRALSQDVYGRLRTEAAGNVILDPDKGILLYTRIMTAEYPADLPGFIRQVKRLDDYARQVERVITRQNHFDKLACGGTLTRK